MPKQRPNAPLSIGDVSGGTSPLWMRFVEREADELRHRIAKLVRDMMPVAEDKVRRRAAANASAHSARSKAAKPPVQPGAIMTFRGTVRAVEKALRDAGLPPPKAEPMAVGFAAFFTRVWPYLVVADPARLREVRRKYARALLEFYEESAALFGSTAAAAALPAAADLRTWALPVAAGVITGRGEPPVPLDGWIRLQGAMLLKQYGVPLKSKRISGLVLADGLLGLGSAESGCHEIYRTFVRNSKKAKAVDELRERLANLRAEYELLAEQELRLPTRDVV